MPNVTIVSQFIPYAKWLCCIALFFGCKQSNEDKVYLQLNPSGSVVTPVAFELDKDFTDTFSLMMETEGKISELLFQVEGNKLYFTPVTAEANQEVSYYILKGKASSHHNMLSQTKEKGNLKINQHNKSVLSYRYDMTYPRKGVDSLFKKSGYIHPIITPKGDTLTRIQPPDHHHHYGLWGPWTHTRIDTTRVDFWNLGEGMGSVLFKEFKDSNSGDVFSSFTAAQEHIDFKTQEKASSSS